jgi:hypothetical protein
MNEGGTTVVAVVIVGLVQGKQGPAYTTTTPHATHRR